MIYRSIADVFNSPDAVYNDLLYEVRQTIEACEAAPELEEYGEFLNNLGYNNYPKPKNGIIHNAINPSHGVLKPIRIK